MKVAVSIVAFLCVVGLTTARYQNVCGAFNGLELVPHPRCDRFYICSNGIPVEMNCADGLLYNPETWQCDWSHNVDCRYRIVPDADVVVTVNLPNENPVVVVPAN